MRVSSRHFSIALILVFVTPMLLACGEEASTRMSTPTIVSSPPSTSEIQSTPVTQATPQLPATPVSPTATPATEPAGHRQLTPEELLEYRPNELGSIPIFMYHNLVSDSSLEGHLYRTYDEFWDDLQWLYDRNFYLVGINAVVRGDIDVPPGKHPVVLTFDDSSSMHFSFELGPDGEPVTDENGDYVPTANSAVGIIERFANEHPDFGRTAHFSTIPQFKFSWPEYEQDEWYEAKILWLMDNGYEIGNHTSDHTDLTLMDDMTFARNLAEPYIWISDFVDPDHPGFAMGVLTLPYGAYPEGGWTGEKFHYLSEGFSWEGTRVPMEGALLVCCGPSPSPFHDEYSRLWIPRIRGDDPDFARFGEEIDKGWVILYTSDGNPDTVTIPWPLPQYQWGKLDVEAVTSRGLTLVKYHPETGHVYVALGPVIGPRDNKAYNWVERAYVSL